MSVGRVYSSQYIVWFVLHLKENSELPHNLYGFLSGYYRQFNVFFPRKLRLTPQKKTQLKRLHHPPRTLNRPP